MCFVLFVGDNSLMNDTTEDFEDTKGALRICKSKTDRQHNDQKKKRTNNDLQNTTQKTKD
jgi:hypothetical protein